MGSLPQFVVIGSAKSGTTTLYEYLASHPDVWMARPKEPEFFARDEVWNKGIDWYRSLFEPGCHRLVCGEASTKYSNCAMYPNAAERLISTLNSPKLIYLMREPVDRAYAHWQQRIKTRQNVGREIDPCYGESFEEAISKSIEFVSCSDYLFQISQYLRLGVSQRDFHFLIFEEFLYQPRKHLRELANFLNVDPQPFERMPAVESNVASIHFEQQVKNKFLAQLHAVPGLSRCMIILPKGIKDVGYRLLRRSPTGRKYYQYIKPRAMQEETREKLQDYFEPRILRLEQFLGRKIHSWRAQTIS